MTQALEIDDESLIKSYVWHGGKCYFVSTIDRESSSMLGPQRYAETMVWAYDWAKRERGEILHQDSYLRGSIWKHQQICERIFSTGKAEGQES